jgi:hypothetical protein
VLTSLPENSGSPAQPDDGFFSIAGVNPNAPIGGEAIYTMYVRAPASLMSNPANYDILVVNQSTRTDASDSDAMVVPLRARKVFVVDVTVTGNGQVTSNPAGIRCGVSLAGQTQSQCSANFGQGQATLTPRANDPTEAFLGWGGNCPGGVQSVSTCFLNLSGLGRISATATFGPSGSGTTGSTPAAPVVQGWKWVGRANCGPIDTLPGVTLQWDSQGYFCCSTLPIGGVGSPRCAGQRETAADCRNQRNMGLYARLIQPGGCYEADT